MTADAAAGADASDEASWSDGFSGETDRLRDDCGLPRAFLKNLTVGFGAVEDEASASDMRSDQEGYREVNDVEWQWRKEERLQELEKLVSIANPDSGSRIASRRLLDRYAHACCHCTTFSA